MNRFAKQLLPFCSLIFIISLWSFLAPDSFLSCQNFMNVFRRLSVNGTIAAGMTFVIISGGIDLSIGSMMAASGMIGALAMLFFSGASWAQITSGEYVCISLANMLWGTLIGIGSGALFGYLNGLLITRLKLTPFIVTLGSMSIFRGLAYLMNDSKAFTVSDYLWLDNGKLLLPVCVLLFIIVMLLMGFLLKYTPFGRYTYAIGSNVNTAFHAGINVNKMQVWIYTIIGALTGLAAMITTSRASSAQPSAGQSLELDVIAAVIIGGCSPSGGRGTMLGTFIGILLIDFLRNGLTLLNISANVQYVVIGLIIIFSVTADRLVTKRK